MPASRLGALVRSPLAWLGLVTTAAVAVYLSSLGFGFTFDDEAEVVRNPAVVSPGSLLDGFRGMGWASGPRGLYRPLTVLSYALNHAAAGLQPWSYHAVNVSLHALVCALLLAVGLRLGLTVPAAGVAALLFAVHPIHVEAVVNVAGRKELLAAACALAAVLAHGRARERGGAWLALAPLLMLAAMLAKETGVMALGLIGLVALADRAAERPRPGASRRRLTVLGAAYVGALAAYFALRTAAGVGMPENVPFWDNPAAYASLPVRVMTATAVVGQGLGLQAFPARLSPDYSWDAIPLVDSPADPRLIFALVVLVVGVASALWMRRRTAIPLVALGWYGLTLLPASNLLVSIGTIFGERLLYLPSAGACLLVGQLIASALGVSRPRLAAALTAAAALALGGRTVSYAAVWVDDLSLFKEAARAAPASYKVHENLGLALDRKGLVADAISELEQARAIVERSGRPRLRLQLSLANAYAHAGRAGEAEREYAQLLAARPTDADALYGLGSVRRLQNRLPEAAGLWRQAIEADPAHVESLGDLGSFSLLNGDPGQAEELWTRAATADPSKASTWFNLGALHESRGNLPRARECWAVFLRHAGREFPAEAAEVERKLAETGTR